MTTADLLEEIQELKDALTQADAVNGSLQRQLASARRLQQAAYERQEQAEQKLEALQVKNREITDAEFNEAFPQET